MTIKPASYALFFCVRGGRDTRVSLARAPSIQRTEQRHEADYSPFRRITMGTGGFIL